MRLAIVACDILEREIEFLTKDDPDFVHREYIEFALHENPPEMKRVLLEKVNALKGRVDAVFLGYAVCNSLEKVTDEFEVPAVMLPGADCIDALLGTDEYAREKKVCPGTWFCSPGWAMEGTNGLIKEMHLDSMVDEGYDPSFFFDILFQSYERTLYIDSGIGDSELYEQKAREFSDEIGLRVDCRTCGLDRIRETIERTKELGREIAGERRLSPARAGSPGRTASWSPRPSVRRLRSPRSSTSRRGRHRRRASPPGPSPADRSDSGCCGSAPSSPGRPPESSPCPDAPPHGSSRVSRAPSAWPSPSSPCGGAGACRPCRSSCAPWRTRPAPGPGRPAS